MLAVGVLYAYPELSHAPPVLSKHVLISASNATPHFERKIFSKELDDLKRRSTVQLTPPNA
jgi:hypothetical protein